MGCLVVAPGAVRSDVPEQWGSLFTSALQRWLQPGRATCSFSAGPQRPGKPLSPQKPKPNKEQVYEQLERVQVVQLCDNICAVHILTQDPEAITKFELFSLNESNMNTVDDDLHVRMRGMGVEMLSEAVCYYLVISGEQCTVCSGPKHTKKLQSNPSITSQSSKRSKSSSKSNSSQIPTEAQDDCCVHCILACLFCEFLTLCNIMLDCATCGSCAGDDACFCCCCASEECGDCDLPCDMDCGIIDACSKRRAAGSQRQTVTPGEKKKKKMKIKKKEP
ncbi:hypothetical protein F2P81_012862 [Scophthalmus maximus]|uniref:Uncharacterized protein n=1 Tax=Scophthalmus maximus TaxID=52904 RepID=A0A6A4SVN4_SCOMX|nr:hypothetical protein F2P81_012862 [Scophthalmus maximus]